MGNKNSAQDSDTESNCSGYLDKRPEWSSEICTPNLTVLMTADSRHVVVKYRTNGNEVLEIKARGTDPSLTREIVEFGKALHHFAVWDDTEERGVPTCTLFMNDSEGINHHCGFVEISVSRQVQTEQEKKGRSQCMSVPSIILNGENADIESKIPKSSDCNLETTKRSSLRLDNISEENDSDKENQNKTICEETVARKQIYAEKSSVDVDLARLNEHDPVVFDELTMSNCPDEPNAMQPSSIFETLRQAADCLNNSKIKPTGILEKSISTNRGQDENMKDNRDTRRLSESAKYPRISRSMMKKTRVSSMVIGLNNGNTKSEIFNNVCNGNPERHAKTVSLAEVPTEMNREDHVSKPANHSISSSRAGKVSDGEELLRQCRSNLRPTPTKQRKDLNVDLQSTERTEFQLKAIDIISKQGTKGLRNMQNNEKNPRTAAWLAFVRTLKHHDSDTPGGKSFSNFSNLVVEHSGSNPESD